MPLTPSRTVAELRELQELTGDENGAQRVAWTEPWEQAREWLRGKVDGLPVEEEIDEAGNQWFTLRGASERAARARSRPRPCAGGAPPARARSGLSRAAYRAGARAGVYGAPARRRARHLRGRALADHVDGTGGARGLDADGQAPRRARRGREARARDPADRRADGRGRGLHLRRRRLPAGDRHIGRRDRRTAARPAP